MVPVRGTGNLILGAEGRKRLILGRGGRDSKLPTQHPFFPFSLEKEPWLYFTVALYPAEREISQTPLQLSEAM